MCVRETERGGGIIVLLVMDVKGLKLDVIRTTRLYYILYMDTMEWKDGAEGVLGGVTRFLNQDWISSFFFL